MVILSKTKQVRTSTYQGQTKVRITGSGRPSKVTTEIKKIVDNQMKEDDETTAHQLHALLVKKKYAISITMVLQQPSHLLVGPSVEVPIAKV